MDRNKMITVLAAITEGELNPADLLAGRGYFLTEETPGVFRDSHTGISYTQDEIDAIYADIERRNAMRKQILNEASYEPMVIIHLPDKSKIAVTIEVEPAPVVEVIEDPEPTPEVIEPEKKTYKQSKKSKPKTFNLLGEKVDRQRAEKMDEFKNINNQL